MARVRIRPTSAQVSAHELSARLAKMPKALPSKRPRSLTNPSSAGSETGVLNQETTEGSPRHSSRNSIETSSLFRIPIELRRAIYKLVFSAPDHDEARGVYQILNTTGSLCYVNCPWSGHSYHFSRCFQAEGSAEPNQITPDVYKTGHYDWCEKMYRRDENPMAILQTCRQIYREAIDVLYNDHVFHFRHYLTLIDFSRTVPQARLDTIHVLCLTIEIPNANLQKHFDHQMTRITGDSTTTGEKTWRIVAGMKSLASLTVYFTGSIGQKPGRKVELLQPLALVRQTSSFHVTVPWSKKEGEQDLQDVPYVLHWTDQRYEYDDEDEDEFIDEPEENENLDFYMGRDVKALLA